MFQGNSSLRAANCLFKNNSGRESGAASAYAVSIFVANGNVLQWLVTPFEFLLFSIAALFLENLLFRRSTKIFQPPNCAIFNE